MSSGSEYIGFDIDPAELLEPRSPVFADVDWEMHHNWRPGGMTMPLSDTPIACLREGLEELVAGPPRFRAVKLPVSQIKAA